ncbi:helix-turn-helix domain-containing protein [Phycicoccus sp. CMS6Z-2]|nr:helix-turn-helix domain-containing protein [Phycicoccus flavus]
MPDTLLLTLDEVARQLRCARRSVERHIASHRLRTVHLGRSVRVERRELERFAAEMREPDDAYASQVRRRDHLLCVPRRRRVLACPGHDGAGP